MDEFDTQSETPPPASAMVERKHKFRGRPLEPYSFARRLVMRAVFTTESEEPASVWTCGLIFLLTLTDEQAQDVLFAPSKFRAPLMLFINSLDTESYNEAVEVSDAVLAEVRATKVVVEAPAGAGDPLKVKKNP